MANINFTCSLLTLWLMLFVWLWWRKKHHGENKRNTKRGWEQTKKHNWHINKRTVQTEKARMRIIMWWMWGSRQRRRLQRRTENKLIFIFYWYVSSKRVIFFSAGAFFSLYFLTSNFSLDFLPHFKMFYFLFHAFIIYMIFFLLSIRSFAHE